MASIKLKFRPSSITDKEGVIFYQIIHERKVRQLLTDYHIFASEWNKKRSVLDYSTSDRRSYIISVRERIRWDMERLNRIVKILEDRGTSFSSDDIIEEYRRYSQEYSLFNFMESQIIKLKQNNKIRTSETYTATLNSFKKFRQDEDIMLDNITTDIIEAYEAYLHSRGVTPNTSSFYMRILRAVYNRAVEENIIEQRSPFRRVYTGIDKTVKRAINLRQLKKLTLLDLSSNPALDFARDMFVMSFYLRGMSFIDMAFLKKTDLREGFLSYRRHKTGQLLTIEWTSQMQTLLDKYPENPTQYLLPIITNPTAQERSAYRNKGYTINRNLKKIAGQCGINIPLTMYVARHTWASIARSRGVPISVISEGMGHDSEATTQIYLASFDTSAVDKANSLIMESLK